MGVDDGVPVVVAQLEEHVVADDPGARDEDVNRPARGHRGRDCCLDIGFVRDVAAYGVAAE